MTKSRANGKGVSAPGRKPPPKAHERSPDANKGGRPSLLTHELIDLLEKTVEEMGFLSVSARVCGVSERALTYWMQRGDHEGQDTTEDDPTGIYLELRWRIHMAQAKREKKLLASVNDPKWELSKLNHKEYGDRQSLELSGDLVVEERVRKMSAAELAAEIAKLEAAP